MTFGIGTWKWKDSELGWLIRYGQIKWTMFLFGDRRKINKWSVFLNRSTLWSKRIFFRRTNIETRTSINIIKLCSLPFQSTGILDKLWRKKNGIEGCFFGMMWMEIKANKKGKWNAKFTSTSSSSSLSCHEAEFVVKFSFPLSNIHFLSKAKGETSQVKERERERGRNYMYMSYWLKDDMSCHHVIVSYPHNHSHPRSSQSM